MGAAEQERSSNHVNSLDKAFSMAYTILLCTVFPFCTFDTLVGHVKLPQVVPMPAPGVGR